MDEAIGHLRETLTIPAELPLVSRVKGIDRPPFGEDEVPPMPAFGEGARLLVTGSTHDAWGYRRTSSSEAQATLVERLTSKVLNHTDEIECTHCHFCDEPELDILLIAYGFTARSALGAVRHAREEGIKAGLLRLTTLWPFPAEAVRSIGKRAQVVLVPEMNRGQMLREVQREVPSARGHHRTDGEVITMPETLAALKRKLDL
jgi:2-oxoglutarate ferredoxin oxidoreductase subunit alpha